MPINTRRGRFEAPRGTHRRRRRRRRTGGWIIPLLLVVIVCSLAGMAASTIAVQSVSAVSEEMSEETLLKRMNEIKEKSGGCFK